MAYKMRTSPMKQTLGVAANMDPQNQMAIKPGAAGSMATPRPMDINPAGSQMVNPFPISEAPINPKAFSNSKAIDGMYGKANAGTFTRTVQNNEAPMMQLANPGMLQDGPQLPPQGVQTSVTPTLGFENS